MKVWLPSHTLTRLARATSVTSALIGLTTLALITPLTSNCFGQFAVVDETSDKGHSILVREGEQLDAAEPHQSGSTPKPYKMLQQIPDKGTPQALNTRSVASDATGGGFISSNSQPNKVDSQESQAKTLSSNDLRSASTGASIGNLRPGNFSASQAPAFTARQAPVFTPRTVQASKSGSSEELVTEHERNGASRRRLSGNMRHGRPVTIANPRKVKELPTDFTKNSQSNEDVAPLPTQRSARRPQQARANNDVIVDRSVAPASYAAPVQSIQNQQNQSRRSMQSLQPRQNTGQTNRNFNRGNQAVQSTPQRQGNRSAKKTSSSAKVLIAKFGFNPSQVGQDISENLVPLRLADVLNQGQMRANRSQLIDQYWATFNDWAQSVSAKQHRDWVNGLRVSKSTDQSTVGVAKSNAENDVTSGRIQLGKSQAKLKSILGTKASIVPADLPTVTMVKTNFQAFKERGLVPARLEGIDQTLKDLHDLVLSRADTVLLAERTAEKVKGYYRSNQATLEQLLGAGRAWRTAEADFLSSTIDYNKAYADYALALPYGRAPVEQVVAMLVVPAKVIPTNAAPSAGRNAQQAQLSRTPSQPASSSRPVPQRRRSTPHTGQDSKVRAASNGFGRSSIPQSQTQRPMPDFSEPSNASAAATSFSSPQTPVFRPNSVASPQPDAVAPQRSSAASRPATRPSSYSFGGGSAGPSATAGARDSSNAITDGFESGNRSASQPVSQPAVKPVTQPATQPVSLPAARSPATPSDSGFSGGKPAARGFSDVSASSPTDSFGSRANKGFKKPSTDPFASRPSIVKPSAKTTDPFGVSGSATKVTPVGSSAGGGFAR